MNLYIRIYIEGEREREREKIHMFVYILLYNNKFFPVSVLLSILVGLGCIFRQDLHHIATPTQRFTSFGPTAPFIGKAITLSLGPAECALVLSAARSVGRCCICSPNLKT